MARPDATVEKLEVQVLRIPTDAPESDGTLAWDATTMVLVRADAGRTHGWGYTYADASAGRAVGDLLADRVVGRDAMDVEGSWAAMREAIRNNGETGIGAMAVSAVDTALWDLKARLLDLPLVSLWGAARPRVPVYGSGGFTSYTLERLRRQLKGWVNEGIGMVKMKVGRRPEDDPERVRRARDAIGAKAGLFVDANGGYSRKQALRMALEFADAGVTWFEEPVVHDDLDGLRLLRDRAPAGMEISIGEYGFDLGYFLRLLQAGAADVCQADASRCGFTGFLRASALCEAFHIPMSSHCAPALHVHVDCAAAPVRHLEYFHDHVRIEAMLFDGAPELADGALEPDLERPGMGWEPKRSETDKYRV